MGILGSTISFLFRPRAPLTTPALRRLKATRTEQQHEHQRADP